MIDGRQPRAADHHYKAQTRRDEQHAREEQPFGAMLDRVKKEEGEDQREEEQQQRAEKRMPEPCLERLAQPNHAVMVLDGAAGSLLRGRGNRTSARIGGVSRSLIINVLAGVWR